ncbi:pyruvate dehydrogenase (acetyl-transferring) E1 component subunit alpha [Opitutaceae bacterium LMO-CP1]|uniref:Pyruvate dehydrogenase E1 component subunit alpha n=2 Tax=Synoicihabitans lomoniglobus TaxID=2909285 RepID=A0AAF0I498_9BACT|nr:pyruvate dehydrogenase (acetyl-transferring) E1 component subunit alpha [Opitutaceae bacterium LMO-M01]WED66644.1 pyruvate dehydrogenase (acetyl-transferring) E1 component subunit alpha [Opitutaceae bacterium LMO-M01]
MSKNKTSTTAEKASDNAKAAINADMSPEAKIELYRQMLRIRRFEERSLRAYQGKKIGGFLHLYIGQEAVAVGCCSLMGDDDHVITAYRDHGHAIAVGMDTKPLMAELYGKVTGCSKGKGGSMHYFSPENNYWGGHGIVGGQIPLGVGLAYGVKYQGKKGAAMAFMGDGAVNQGAVHEAMNLAGLWDLPCIFVIENNGYSMGTSQVRSSAGPGLAERAAAYGIHWANCFGHDVYEVRKTMNDVLVRARETSKPAVVEIDTYRYRGHSVADPDKTYRTRDEIDEYRKNKDPITLFQATLLAEGVLTEESAKEIDQAARQEAEAAAEFAEASPFPTPDDIQSDVYWEADHPDQRTSQGRLFFS